MINIHNRIQACETCNSICGYKKFPVTSHGNRQSMYMLVSEAPGIGSINRREYWSGNSLLRRSCIAAKTTLESLFYLTDIVKCWPSDVNNKNRKPSINEINNCRLFLDEEIRLLKPILIISLGATSGEHLLGINNVKITEKHGKITSLNNALVLTLVHPANYNRFSLIKDNYVSSLKKLFTMLHTVNYNNDILQLQSDIELIFS